MALKHKGGFAHAQQLVRGGHLVKDDPFFTTTRCARDVGA